MPVYTIEAPDGRRITVEAANRNEAVSGVQRWVAANPNQGYQKARQRIDRNEQFTRNARAQFGGGLGTMLDEFGKQVARNTGASDEVGGAVNFLVQGAENIGRRALGKPVEIPASAAYRAAANRERELQQAYAQANPVANAVATGLAIAASGRPTGGAVFTNPLKAGGAAAVQAAPLAFARQEGDFVERLPGTAKDTALAFGLSGAMTAGANALSRSASMSRAKPSPQRRLAQEGVQMTPGQMMGGIGKRLEDALTSAPLTGGAIQARRADGLETFNTAAYNRALAPIGETIDPAVNVGRDAVGEIGQRISQAYTNALDNVTVTPDRIFQQEVGAVVNNSSLPPAVQQDLNAVVNNTILGRFSGAVDGRTWKSVDEELGAMIRSADNASSMQPTQRYLADSLREVKRALGSALERSDPNAFAAVKQADEAFANFARIRQGAQAAGVEDGIMTPAQMARAVRAMDSSAGNRQFAQGDALMQDLAETGKAVLPSKIPDSGTPLRLAAGAGVYGGMSGAVSPMAGLSVAAVDAAGAALYSRPVMRAINALYQAKDPGAVRSALGQFQALAARNPALVPAYQEMAQRLGVLPEPSAGLLGTPPRRQEPTTP